MQLFVLYTALLFSILGTSPTPPELPNANWESASEYVSYISKPIAESSENYAQWETTGGLLGTAIFESDADGIELLFCDPVLDGAIYQVQGYHICYGITSQLYILFPELHEMAEEDITLAFLSEYLGLNFEWVFDEDDTTKILYARVEGQPFSSVRIWGSEGEPISPYSGIDIFLKVSHFSTFPPIFPFLRNFF